MAQSPANRRSVQRLEPRWPVAVRAKAEGRTVARLGKRPVSNSPYRRWHPLAAAVGLGLEPQSTDLPTVGDSIVGGYSESPISGNMAMAGFGGVADAWAVKLDANGQRSRETNRKQQPTETSSPRLRPPVSLFSLSSRTL